MSELPDSISREFAEVLRRDNSNRSSDEHQCVMKDTRVKSISVDRSFSVLNIVIHDERVGVLEISDMVAPHARCE